MSPYHGSRRRTCSLIALVAAASSAMVSCEPQPARPQTTPAKTLTILSPHGADIRASFEAAFAKWYRQEHRTDVEIVWIVRGTPKCVDYVEDYHVLPREAAPARAPDVLFGGGVRDHRLLAERGRSLPLQIDVPVDRIPAEIAGVPMRDGEGRWFATGLTSFGILYNQRACQGRRIDPPSSWSDLGDPRFRGWLALAGPDVSGSTRQCLMVIVQQHGWDKGWDIITRTLANARTLVAGSPVALGQVESGESLAAFASNFDGQARATGSDGSLRYIDSPQGTALTPDIVSVLQCASDAELARRFVEYCLSPEGQALWGLREERRRSYAPTLYYYPIDRTLYAQRGDDLAVVKNPIEGPVGFRLDPAASEEQAAAIVPLVLAACGENHLLLQRVWKAIIEAGMPAETTVELTSPPFDEQVALELGRRFAAADRVESALMIEELAGTFKSKYERALRAVNASTTAGLSPASPQPGS